MLSNRTGQAAEWISIVMLSHFAQQKTEFTEKNENYNTIVHFQLSAVHNLPIRDYRLPFFRCLNRFCNVFVATVA